MRKQQLIILLLAILTIGFIGCEKEKTSEVSDTAGDEIVEEVLPNGWHRLCGTFLLSLHEKVSFSYEKLVQACKWGNPLHANR